MRLRITFAKTGSLRYIGHLDLHQVWERTARRAGLPLAYTQGFHPGPKIQIAAALPLGFIGRAEVVDLWINEPGEIISRPYKDLLQSAAPPGLTIVSAGPVDEGAPPLQTQVAAAEYEVNFLETGLQSALEAKVAELLAKPSLPRERRGKPYDLRPLVLSLEAGTGERRCPACTSAAGTGEPVEGSGWLRMVLSAREGATGRPEEVLAELGIPSETARVERTRLIFKNEIESK
jgi:radical SAM-linked protein